MARVKSILLVIGEEGGFINEQNDKAVVHKNDAFNMSDDDIAIVYDKNKWFSDWLQSD